MLPEEWRPHPTYGDLVQASSLGQVRQFNFLRKEWVLLPQRMHKHGYLMVSLRQPVLKCGIKAHALVAEAWYGKRPVGHDVAHKDGNKTNNRADNLLFCSSRANAAHKRGHGTLKCPLVVSIERARSCRDCGTHLKGKRVRLCRRCSQDTQYKQRDGSTLMVACQTCGTSFPAVVGAPNRYCSKRCTGRRASNRKLSEAQVIAIRASAGRGSSYKAIARSYGVCDMVVRRIALRETWQQLQ